MCACVRACVYVANILTSGGPGGTSGAHTTNTGATVSTCSCEYLARLQEFVLRWPIVPEVAPGGPGFARGVWPLIGQLPNLSICQVGLAFLTGLAFSVLLIPVNYCLARKIGQLSTAMMTQKDARVKVHSGSCVYSVQNHKGGLLSRTS